MITLTTEQAQQIEEALEDIVRVFKFETGTPVEALAAIRAARAQEQAEQEPVAEILVNDKDVIVLWHKTARQLGHQAKLYAAPVRTKNLKDDEIARLMNKHGFTDTNNDINLFNLVYDIVAADREKNR